MRGHSSIDGGTSTLALSHPLSPNQQTNTCPCLPVQFVKKRGAFQYDLDPNAPVLELNGRARWAVEKEMREQRRMARTTAAPQTKTEAEVQNGVYLQNPVKLIAEQGYKVLAPDEGAAAAPAAAPAASTE